MPYVLDTNVFLQAKNLHYGFDFCPGFWDWLKESNRKGTVFSIEKVRAELVDDDAVEWADQYSDEFFLKPDAAVGTALAKVSQWVIGQGYEPGAVNTFLQVADYYLVAHALATGHTVVTHEVPANSVKKIKIPNACIGLGITCMNPGVATAPTRCSPPRPAPHSLSMYRRRIMPHIAYACEIGHNPPVKPVVWMGGSREDLRKFPETAQDALGFALYRVQTGLDPKDWKPMTSVGVGVKEIRVRDEAGIFRMIYLATRPEGVYVLHCFQKKTQRTGRSDLELATKRLKSIAR